MVARILDRLFEILFPLASAVDGLSPKDRRYLDGAFDLVDLERRQREIEYKRHDNGRRLYM